MRTILEKTERKNGTQTVYGIRTTQDELMAFEGFDKAQRDHTFDVWNKKAENGNLLIIRGH